MCEELDIIQIDSRSHLEVADSKHRYGKNLRMYFKEYARTNDISQISSPRLPAVAPTRSSNSNSNSNSGNSDSSGGNSFQDLLLRYQPFFAWLDDPVNPPKLSECPRNLLDEDRVLYLRSDEERAPFEIICESNGRLVRRSDRNPLTTGSKGWIFVMKDNRIFAAEKRTSSFPRFHHSSFFSGAGVHAAGLLVCAEGNLTKMFAHSGHYRPHDRHLCSLLNFLAKQGVVLKDLLVDVQRVFKASRSYDKAGTKGKKSDSVLYSDGQHTYDFLCVKKHFWDAGVFHEINSLRRGENDIKIPSSDEVESDYDTRRKTRHSSDNPDTIVTRLLSTSWPMTYDAVGNMKLDDNKKNVEKDVYNEQYKMKGIGMREFEVGEIDSGVNQSAQTISENRCFNQNSTSARAGVLSRMLSGSHISVGENVESSSTSYSQPGCGNNQVTQLHSSKKVPTIEDVKLGFDLSQHCSTLPNHRFTKDSATFLSSEAKSTQSSRRPSLNSLDDEVFVTDRVPKTFLHSHLKGLNSSSIDDHCSPLFDVRTGNALKIEFSAISPKKLLRGNSGSSDHDSSFDIHLRTLLAESPSIPYDTGHRLPPNVSGITTSLGSQASGDSLVLDSHSLQNPPAVAAKVEDNQSGSSFEGMIKAQDTNKEEADDSPNTSNASLSSKEDGPNDLTENNSKPVSPTARDTVKSVLEQILTLSAIMEDANESSCHSEHVASLLQVVNEIKTQDDFPPVEIPSVD